MRFDEATGATQVRRQRRLRPVRDLHGTGCPLTGEAVRGQIGLAAQFDGVNDNVEVGNFGTFNTTTVSAWVKRTGATTARETIVSYKESSNCGFVLDLEEPEAQVLRQGGERRGRLAVGSPAAKSR